MILSSPYDFCVCVKHDKVFVQNENGQLERWLRIDDKRNVLNVYPTAASTDYICKAIRIGFQFNLQKNGSWFCDKHELTLVTDFKACYG